MTSETASETLGAFAAGIDYDDIPEAARDRLKQCLIDAVACVTYGATKPWAQYAMAVAEQTGSSGHACLPGRTGNGMAPGPAALALGVCCHAFEQDGLRRPSVGVHGAATVAVPVLVLAQHLGKSGREAITAMAAGIEVMIRVGAATKHSPEKHGFHAPGLIGPYGGAVACSKLMGADAKQIVNAMGIAGSFSSGLLAFSKAKSGGMVKRLHMGRAAEGGVLAALLAAEGFEGPETVIDGTFGLLDTFCSETDTSKLTAGLGTVWESETLCFKRYPAHITSHAPVTGLNALREEHGFGPDDIERIEIRGSKKITTHHDIKQPGDIMQAQYSMPFNVARSLYHDIMDPDMLTDELLTDEDVLTMAQKITLAVDEDVHKLRSWSAAMTVWLKDGRQFDRTIEDWPGMPQMPFTDAQLADKFKFLTRSLSNTDALLGKLQGLQDLESLRELDWS